MNVVLCRPITNVFRRNNKPTLMSFSYQGHTGHTGRVNPVLVYRLLMIHYYIRSTLYRLVLLVRYSLNYVSDLVRIVNFSRRTFSLQRVYWSNGVWRSLVYGRSSGRHTNWATRFSQLGDSYAQIPSIRIVEQQIDISKSDLY